MGKMACSVQKNSVDMEKLMRGSFLVKFLNKLMKYSVKLQVFTVNRTMYILLSR
jgi:hypothetical protein